MRCESVACIYSHNPFTCLTISLCVCAVAACFLFRCLFLCLPPFCYRSPILATPPTLFAHRLSFSDAHTHTHNAHTHTHTEAHAVPHWIRASDYSMPSEELLYLAFIRPQLQGKVAFCRGPDLSWNFTHPGFIIIRRCFLISIIFAAAVQGYISLAATQAI